MLEIKWDSGLKKLNVIVLLHYVPSSTRGKEEHALGMHNSTEK